MSRRENIDGCGTPSKSIDEPKAQSRYAGFNCPHCGRPTLEATPDELTDFRCSVCELRVREEVAK
jgi:transcription elongation factor Elf1